MPAFAPAAEPGSGRLEEALVYVWAGLLAIVCLIAVIAFIRAVQ